MAARKVGPARFGQTSYRRSRCLKAISLRRRAPFGALRSSYNTRASGKDDAMPATDAVVRTRIDRRVKEQATSVLADMGLSVSDAIRLLLARIAAEKVLPFEVKVPNAVTARTLRKADRGEDLARARDAAELFEKLGI
ncbi:MAG TPA: type II toxin-antitoxin system RelB/DinJ family antitoxin [Geminicoccaceae bacterium]|nr:type II toxin-antitoxin system RelB/DinJ family antitoxin [Geminicoccaceae bacterium]